VSDLVHYQELAGVPDLNVRWILVGWMPACGYSPAPKRRISPVPPHRRHLPQRSGLLEFLLVPPHDGQRRIG